MARGLETTHPAVRFRPPGEVSEVQASAAGELVARAVAVVWVCLMILMDATLTGRLRAVLRIFTGVCATEVQWS